MTSRANQSSWSREDAVVGRDDRSASPAVCSTTGADLGLVEAQASSASSSSRNARSAHSVGARRADRRERRRLGARGAAHGELGDAARAIDRERDVVVRDRGRRRARARAASSAMPGAAARPVARARRARVARVAHGLVELAARDDLRRRGPIPPRACPCTPSASVQNTSARSRRTLRLSTRRVSPPVPGSTASSGVSGRRHRRVAVVDEHDLVARERELVAAARARCRCTRAR